MLLFCGYCILHQTLCKRGGEIIQKQQGTQLMFILDEVNIRLNIYNSTAGQGF